MMIAVLPFSLMIPDIVFRWQRSGMSRYFVPCYLGFGIAVAYVISKQIISQKTFNKGIWSSVMIILVSFGVFSCFVISQSESWWTKIQSFSVIPIARAINKVDSPLVISNTSVGNILALAWILDSDVKLILNENIDTMLTIPNNFDYIFLYQSSKLMQEKLKSNYKIEKFENFNNFKRLTNKNLVS